MKLDKIFLASCATMVLAGCVNDNVPGVEPTPGKDVIFGVSLNTPKNTRTIYGEEVNNASGHYFPIYWKNGDQVKIISPECSIKEGTYQISASGTQNVATGVVKVGEAGVQWGNNTEANFYSIYPANKVQNVDAANSKMSLRLPHIQNVKCTPAAGTSTVQSAKADMDAGFLYSVGKGTPDKAVNLSFNPLATAVRFTLNGPSENGDVKSDITIQQVILQAPKETVIGGDFDVTFSASGKPTIAPKDINNGGENYIQINPTYEDGGFLTLHRGETIELNAFIIPRDESKLSEAMQIGADWQLIVIDSDGNRFVKNLNGTSADGKNMTLAYGQIHKLPALPSLDVPTSVTYNPENWMINIPRNTYLSEISIPGSWNSLNSEFQSNTDLDAQYKAGVRAFHLDARWNATRVWHSTTILGTGYYTYTLTDLGVASGNTFDGTAWDAEGGNCETAGKAMGGQDTHTFATCLKTITDNVKNDEYMVVFVTWAQNSATKNGETWEKAVSDVCASNSKVINASSINKNTIVNDVLGKVIVIVNTEGTTPTIQGSKCFFVNAPLTLPKSMFVPTVKYGENLLHYGSNDPSDITLFTSQCQIEYNSLTAGGGSQESSRGSRGYLPDPDQRKKQLNGIITWSKDNYDGTKPNNPSGKWIYLGLGGYQGRYATSISEDVTSLGTSSYETVAQNYNNWISDDIIDKMSGTPDASQGQTRFYPVGIVLMNFVTNTTYGTPVVNNILQLNNRFQKGYDANKKAWPNGRPSSNTGGSNTPQVTDYSSTWSVSNKYAF